MENLKTFSQNALDFIKRNLTKNARKGMLTVFILSVIFQRVIIVKVISNVKLIHIVGAFIFPFALVYQSKNHISRKVVLLISLLYLQTILAYLKYGFSTWFLNMIFCTATVFIAWKLSDDFSLDDWLEIGKFPGLLLFICISINMLIYKEAVWQYLIYPTAAHPWHKSFLSGGINEDSTWLGLFTFLAVGSPWWLPMITMVFVFSFLENSRAGLLSAIAFTVWAVVHWLRKKCGKNASIKFPGEWNTKFKTISLILSICIIVIFLIMQIEAYASQRKTQTEIQDNINSADIYEQNDTDDKENYEQKPNIDIEYHGAIENLNNRLFAIGNEPGSMGRLGIWKWVPKEVFENVWGYGLGNGKKQIDENDPSGATIELVDNVHNIYLQVLLEQGIVGFAALLIILFMFVKREIKTLASNPLAAYLLCYFCLGMIQDRFINVPMWFVVGAYASHMSNSNRDY